MKKAKIPTIIGIILLTLGLAAGVIVVQNRQIFRLGAEGENSPKDVRTSNVASTSLTISWITDVQTSGFVKYGESSGSIDKTKTEEATTPSYTHFVNLEGLKPQTNYFLKINSGGTDFDSNGVAWQVQTTTAESDSERGNLISGSILLSTGAPSKGAIVYVTVNGVLYSALTSDAGSWIASIPKNINEASTLLDISVQGGASGVSTAQIYPQSAKPVPSIILGQTYDLRNLPPSSTSDIPKASLGVPDAAVQESGFDVPEGTSTVSAETVTLESISNNEIITSVKPEFFGEGPAGTTIQITVESEIITDTVEIPSSGEWNWEIPENLPEGPHTITISWKDASGILRILTRNFIIQASEGPAFVSTPSATPTQSPTTTPKASVTPKPTSTATVSATPFPQPESGSLTPTLLLSIMGVGIISFAFLLWRKSEI